MTGTLTFTYLGRIKNFARLHNFELFQNGEKIVLVRDGYVFIIVPNGGKYNLTVYTSRSVLPNETSLDVVLKKIEDECTHVE